MKIAILERTNFNAMQLATLQSLGSVDFYDGLTQDEANHIAPQYDIVVVNWLDPTPFILNMKPNSLISLLSTGYGWISNIKEAHNKHIYVSNIPSYSTEAVAEHLLGLTLGVSKNIFCSLNSNNSSNIGFELCNKTLGIIGLGNIGKRFAEIMHTFNANIITYNRHSKNSEFVRDVELNYLLEKSDIICITCSVNDESRDLINMGNIAAIKKSPIIVGSTWNIIQESALLFALENGIIKAAAFDAAIESGDTICTQITQHSKIFLTPHIAYNTYESELRQLDICVNNICRFVSGNPQNIVM